MRTGFLQRDDRNVLELDSGSGCTTFDYTKNHFILHLKRVNFMVCELYINKNSSFSLQKTSLRK